MVHSLEQNLHTLKFRPAQKAAALAKAPWLKALVSKVDELDEWLETSLAALIEVTTDTTKPDTHTELKSAESIGRELYEMVGAFNEGKSEILTQLENGTPDELGTIQNQLQRMVETLNRSRDFYGTSSHNVKEFIVSTLELIEHGREAVSAILEHLIDETRAIRLSKLSDTYNEQARQDPVFAQQRAALLTAYKKITTGLPPQHGIPRQVKTALAGQMMVRGATHGQATQTIGTHRPNELFGHRNGNPHIRAAMEGVTQRLYGHPGRIRILATLGETHGLGRVPQIKRDMMDRMEAIGIPVIH
ncbi:MAG: hypothetical protein Q8P27_02730 [Candidatus Peregrinibacteria bacterium]|nr:hypothetical protein [Candidatus Peregrinibacteria bacterium]